MQPPIRACLWDLGVVVRTEWEDHVAEWLIPAFGLDERRCAAVFTEAWSLIERRCGDAAALEREWAAHIVSRLPIDIEPAELAEQVRQSIRFHDAEQTEDTLRWLQARGILLGIASNDNEPFFEHAWRALRLDRFFDRAGGPVFVSCFAGKSKGDAGFFEMVVDRLEFPPGQVLFIDDRAANVQAADASVGLASIPGAERRLRAALRRSHPAAPDRVSAGHAALHSGDAGPSGLGLVALGASCAAAVLAWDGAVVRILADACLDAGGVFEHAGRVCEFRDAHLLARSTDRTPWLFLAAGLLAALGIDCMRRARRRERAMSRDAADTAAFDGSALAPICAVRRHR